MDDRRRMGGVRPDSDDSGIDSDAEGLVSSAARNLTTLLSFGRETAMTAVEEATDRAGRLVGAIRDAGDRGCHSWWRLGGPRSSRCSK